MKQIEKHLKELKKLILELRDKEQQLKSDEKLRTEWDARRRQLTEKIEQLSDGDQKWLDKQVNIFMKEITNGKTKEK